MEQQRLTPRGKKKENKKKQLEYATERKTMISNGLRTLNIAILNPDSMREATMKEIIKGLARNRIHIAEIQETNITKDRSYIMGNYKIITAAADKNDTTGIVSWGQQ